jgi:hypothetical protein
VLLNYLEQALAALVGALERLSAEISVAGMAARVQQVLQTEVVVAVVLVATLEMAGMAAPHNQTA